MGGAAAADAFAGVFNKAVDTAAQSFLMNQQAGLNFDQWKAQAWYNKPVNQMARLKEAGLNPNLVFGTGSVSNDAGSVAPTSIPSPGNPVFSAGSIMNYAIQRKQLELENRRLDLQEDELKHRNPVHDANARNANAEAQGKEIDNQYKAEYMSVTIDNLRKQGYLTDVQAAELQSRIDVNQATVENFNSSTRSIDWNTAKSQWFSTQEYRNLTKEEQVMSAKIVDLYASAGLKNSEIEFYGEKIKFTKTENDALEWQTDFNKEHAETSLYFDRVNSTLGSVTKVIDSITGALGKVAGAALSKQLQKESGQRTRVESRKEFMSLYD